MAGLLQPSRQQPPLQHAFRQGRQSQRGAAILTAMLVVTLAAILTSSLFYRENVAVRSIENRLALSQTRWVERAAIDWAKVILRSDPANYDHMSDVWGTPVVETQLDETVTGGARVGDRSREAFLAGAVTDAQSRFNVRSLVDANGSPVQLQLDAMRKLMGLLGQPESLVDQVLARLLQSRSTTLDGRTVPATALPLMQFGDLRDLPGFGNDTMQILQPHVTVLPEPTMVNANTATAEVIAAIIPDLSLGAAKAFVQQRDRSALITDADIKSRLGSGSTSDASLKLLSVNTKYFLVHGVIRYDRVESQTETLVLRGSSGPRGNVQVIWQHRN